MVVKTFLAWSFPFTCDEAYLALWGKYVASGYYDHPPILGWLLHLLQYLGRSPVLLRLMPIIFSTAVGVGIYALLRPYDQRKAFLVFLLFILSPINMVFFIVNTDTPLLLFSFLSAFLLFEAETKRRYLYYLLSGILFGLAFLSKYFAVLLGLSYLFYLLSVHKDARRLKGFLLLALGAFPFVLQNTLWNYHRGWPNIMHNSVNRLRAHSSPLLNLLCLAVILCYLIPPPVFYFLFKNRRGLFRKLLHKNFRIFAVASLLPLCVFFAVSLRRAVRPHWYASFAPFAYLMLAVLLDNNQLIKSIKFAFFISLVQVFLLIAAPFAPIARLKGLVTEGDFASLVTHRRPEEVLEPLQQHKDRFILATKSYSISALLEHHSGERVIVFGKGSRHGRQDDITTNFKELDGSNIIILRKGAKYDRNYHQCFEKMEVTHLEVEGATFSLLLGHGFKYQEYRERYLRTALRAYYRIPDWLPGSRSFFHEKYDFQLAH
jgi:hypothetical protein